MSSGEFGDNGALKIDYDSASVGTDVLLNQDTTDCDRGIAAGTLTVNSGAVAQAEERVAESGYHCFVETGSNTGIFTNTDDADLPTIKINTSAKRGTTASIDYNDSAQSVLVTTSGATIDMAGEEAGDEWTLVNQ
jgi:hypothetical protein